MDVEDDPKLKKILKKVKGRNLNYEAARHAGTHNPCEHSRELFIEKCVPNCVVNSQLKKVPGHVRAHEMTHQFVEEKKVVLTTYGKKSIRESITKRSPLFSKVKNLFKGKGGWIGGDF